jgi:uncharacterized membrane protein YgcG
MNRTSVSAALVAAALLPTTVEACGGFFCNAATPLNQAAERILFAVDGDSTVMHVQVDYQGPPVDFGWILPVPRGVETALSSEALFQALDTAVGPRFLLNFEFDDECEVDFPVGGDSPPTGGQTSDGGGVTVVSRENVGPYDRAILEAENVAALRVWLDENQFAIPRDFDERLVPYIEAGAVFVVIKLLPGVDTGEIVPLKLSFPGTTPSVPIVPTAVAATPDLGVIVHVLGRNRAIPLNYRHVQINEATIDWASGGQNYPDVVSQAADEAGGHAFTTDFAGPLEQLRFVLPVVSAEALTELGAVRDLRALDQHLCNFGFEYSRLNDPDASRIFTSSSAEVRAYFQTNGVCSFEFAGVENPPVDGAALADKVRTEINEVRDDLNALFGRQTYLTRLYSTLSPVEMDRDPLFDFNPDLADVPNVRTATARVSCEDGFADTQNYELITSTGVRVQVRAGANPMTIRRRDGLTVQQGAMPAAAVVERLSTSGPAEIIQAADLPTGGADAGAGGGGGGPGNFDAGTGGSGGGGGKGQVSSGDDDGCSTRPGAGGGALGLVLAAFSLAALSRRRASRSQSST